jgi:ABC-type dipeptide/oligopeptide/nickel transport system permease component
MSTYITRRLLALIPILIFTSFVTFELVRLTPGDPALIMVGGRRTTPETLQAIRTKYALDKDPITQYVLWVGNALQGDLGESFRLKQQVSDLIVARLPLTLKLILLSTMLSLLIALPLGVFSALYQNSWIDYVASLICLIGVSSPVFFSGIIGILVFAYWLGWLPALGAGQGFWDQLYHLILPASVLALSMLALTARMTRSAMLEVLRSEYITVARAKGLAQRSVVIRHALRNALIPVLTVASLQLGFLFVGTVLVEYTFGLGGLGSLITDAIQNRDYPLIQGCVLVLVTIYVLLNLVTDLLYGVIDPRIRYH